MKTYNLKIQKRDKKYLGKHGVKKLRKEGNVPGVIYGYKENNINIQVPVAEVEKALSFPELYKFECELEGKKMECIIKDVDFHPVTDIPIHIDLLKINNNKEIIVEVPVKPVGISKGVLEGGKLEVNLRKLKVKALPDKIPSTLEINVDNLEIGDSIKVKDLSFDGLKFLNPPNLLVIGVKITRAAISAEEEAKKETKSTNK